jgi:hypothetical protein
MHFIQIYTNTYICMSVHTYMHTYTYIQTYTYIHTDIYIYILSCATGPARKSVTCDLEVTESRDAVLTCMHL